MTATATKRRPKAASIEIPHEDLADALRAVAPAIPGKAGKPILANVLIAGGVVTGTDLELRIDVAINQVTPAVLLPHARLSNILKLFEQTKPPVELTPGETSCVVEVGSGRWTLPTESPLEFPADAGGDAVPICRLPADQFCRAVLGTVFATDNESSRYALGAVLIEVDTEGTATFVGTDGRRLARVDAELDQAVDASRTLIPARAIAAMARLADGSEDAVQLERRGTDVVCTCGGVTVTTRTTEGHFPKWRDVFPERDCKPSMIHAGALLAATRSAAIVTTETSKGVTFAFTEQGLHLTARSSESGESSVTCEVVEFGTAAVTQLDPHFVEQWLRTLDPAATVEVEVADGTTACVLRCEESSCVIMPLAKDA